MSGTTMLIVSRSDRTRRVATFGRMFQQSAPVLLQGKQTPMLIQEQRLMLSRVCTAASSRSNRRLI